jgi:Zinc carboxypeptidase
MRTRLSLRALVVALALLALSTGRIVAQQNLAPEAYFGFKIGADGELAKYPKVLEYFQALAKQTDRVKYEELGKTTMGNSYALLRISSPQNLANFDRLVEINRRLADPRGLSEAEAQKLALEGKPFYLVYATIHSTEVSNGQAIINIVHRLATENSTQINDILNNSVVLMVPSQNPDGQHLVIDHWYKTKGTPFNRVFPDLYHKYVGHDDNRDWFMFTQKETRMNIELVQNKYKPIITHDMHQQGGNGSRIFVPPFTEPFDSNMHPLLRMGQATVGQAMASALLAEGKEGVAWEDSYDMWSPARQYMVYHGQPRILTEIANSALADPVKSADGKPLGPQESRAHFPVPYSKDTWTLGQQVDYGVTAAFAGMSHVAKYGHEWLFNFYRVHRDWVNYNQGPYAFVVSSDQRDPYGLYEMLSILQFGAVEIQRASAAFTANGKQYPAGSFVIKTAQPYGAFAKTMLERQNYPDLRLFPGGPPEPPYDVTGHTLWMLTGVTVDAIDKPFEAPLEMVKAVAPMSATVAARPKGAYLVGPESYGTFKMVAELQKANVPIYRASKAFESSAGAAGSAGATGSGAAGSKTFAPGTWVIPPTAAAQQIIEKNSKALGVSVSGTDKVPAVDGYRLKPNTKVGLYKAAGNMPAGWMMWSLEQYGINHEVMKAQDFQGDLNAKYDVILLPSGTTKPRMLNGLDAKRNDPAEWSWAFGIGDAGWANLKKFVENGGTLLAIGSAVETARDLLDLPIERALPQAAPRFGQAARTGAAEPAATSVEAALKDAFSSPARLMQTLRDRVAEPESLFYCPGSLLNNEFDPNNPVAWGMPTEWPVFFDDDQAYRLRPGFGVESEVVSRYPRQKVLASGWLLGEEYLKDQANIVAFRIGKGYVVTYGSQIDFRAQPRATFKLIFNAIFHGPSTAVPAAQMGRPSTTATNNDQ